MAIIEKYDSATILQRSTLIVRFRQVEGVQRSGVKASGCDGDNSELWWNPSLQTAAYSCCIDVTKRMVHVSYLFKRELDVDAAVAGPIVASKVDVCAQGAVELDNWATVVLELHWRKTGGRLNWSFEPYMHCWQTVPSYVQATWRSIYNSLKQLIYGVAGTSIRLGLSLVHDDRLVDCNEVMTAAVTAGIVVYVALPSSECIGWRSYSYLFKNCVTAILHLLSLCSAGFPWLASRMDLWKEAGIEMQKVPMIKTRSAENGKEK